MEKETSAGRVICANPECGRETTYEDWHVKHEDGGITHNCSCGYSLVTGTLGTYYTAVRECGFCY